MNDIFSSSSLAIMQKSLDSLWEKQKVISDNIANIDTPGYKSKAVQFEDKLKDILFNSANDSELRKKLSTLEPEVTQENGTAMREDGNNVDIDSESVDLVRTQIQYEYIANMISSEISRMKYAINGGHY